MKQFFQKLSLWWFATMTPEHAPLTTIIEREKLRKRRLLSVLLLLDVVLPFALLPLMIFEHGNILTLGILALFGVVSLFALWINQHGSLIAAGLFYFSIIALLEGLFLILEVYQTPVFAICLWPVVLISLTTIGFFLPAWGPILFSLMLILFYCWFMLVECQQQISTYIADPYIRIFVLSFTCAVTFIIALFNAIATATANKAIVRADRTSELEQAHQSLSRANEQLETALIRIQEQALTDALTGLPNHRAVMDQFTKELEQARRSGRSFSLLFFDADHFKQVNDIHGHAVGDAVLRQIGERAGSVLRTADTLGRFGGEEFVIILSETNAHEARVIAERIRIAIASGPMATTEVVGGINMTVSIGLSTYTLDGNTEQELLSRADEAMYIAKRLGRNQVRTPEDVRMAQADLPLMAFLKQEERREMIQRQGGNNTTSQIVTSSHS